MQEKNIDLIIKEDGKAALTRDVRKGEKITYQNNHLKGIGKTDVADVLEDVSKGAELTAGATEKGKIVIEANVGSVDYLVIKRS